MEPLSLLSFLVPVHDIIYTCAFNECTSGKLQSVGADLRPGQVTDVSSRRWMKSIQEVT